MDTRILHCSNSLENYYLCLEHRVGGFTNRGPQKGDLAIKAVKVLLCAPGSCSTKPPIMSCLRYYLFYVMNITRH